ncbi:tRNA (adenosine(37)-N6)-threonylcarbamoyltransferase complex dimerization subunit type 1 TsaB [Novosphingobium kaempferiae]|uniref:tRNA (adenosine(37)-N6)-threonylcarbamoyltransferase complex dimerization subunit type 1 TsaB n=1 Tax=Novosphingobium kaempferiae TaxID=2896849 RepID=UPI001E6434C7|nr:tRNA (adenosine(37)-N6)-threonylcarbamoyltransferase complex dimerization subunit type 1 TsaB [Novosphingobium kaempferiae]
MTAAPEDSPPSPVRPEPTTLVIDSATEACSVALFAGDTLVAGEYRLLGRGHAEALVPMIAALPNKGRADRIAVALGPGSFTGVRVGLAAARALGLAWGADVLGYPTLSLIAAMARDAQGAQPLAVVTTGGHGEWFVETFDAEGTSTSPLSSQRPDAAAATVGAHFVVGSQAEALVAARGSGHALPLLPDARAFALLPAGALSSDIHPLYGRGPDAKLPAKAAAGAA